MPIDSSSDQENSTEETAILGGRRQRFFHLNTNVELGEIASLYLNKFGHLLFFLSLCIYLYGDLAIYAAASGKTIVNLSCKSNDTEDYSIKCWDEYNITRMDMYRIFVGLFTLIIGPFTYFNVQKTKYLQIFTISIRWCAFIIMVTLAIVRLIKYGPQGHPKLINLSEVPALAGSSVYSFMCHHSLPGLIAPISNKANLTRKIGYDFIIICLFYLLLSITGAFAFETVDDLYSLNFIQSGDSNFLMKIIGFFLVAFPLFPMSTSFPIIAITLQSNLKNLVLRRNGHEEHNIFVKRIIFPTLAVVPPVIVALCTHNLKRLVEITGTYAGVLVQYVIPAALVFYARRQCYRDFGYSNHKYASPFRNSFWFIFIICWAVVCIIFVSVDIFFKE